MSEKWLNLLKRKNYYKVHGILIQKHCSLQYLFLTRKRNRILLQGEVANCRSTQRLLFSPAMPVCQ